MTKSKELLISILREKYDYELSRKKYFDDAIGIPITILSFLIAEVYLTGTDKSLENLNYFIGVMKWFLLGSLLTGCIFTFIFLFRVYFGLYRYYSSFPESSLIVDKDFEALKTYHKHNFDNLSDYDSAVHDSLTDYAITWYKECNTENTSTNDKRAQAFFNARFCIGVSLCIGLILFIFIIINK